MVKAQLGKIERAVLWSLTEIRGRVEMGVVVRFVFHGRDDMSLND